MSFVPVILFLGPPGSGKGTHATRLSKELGISHISTGELLRAHIQKSTPLGQAASQYMEQGALVPDQLVIQMLRRRIEETDCEKGYLLDGFPRTIGQAEEFKEILLPYHDLFVFYLHISDATVLSRITGRQECSKCKKIYHKHFSPSARGSLCGECFTPLSVRQDDTEAVVRKRLEYYHRETAPLLRFYRQKNLLKEIDGERPVEAIFSDLAQRLDLLYVK